MSFEDEVPNSQKSNYNESSIFDSIYDTTISIENEAENYLKINANTDLQIHYNSGNKIKSNIQNCH